MCNALCSLHCVLHCFARCTSCCSLRSLHFVLLTPPWNHLEQPQASGTRVALMELREAPYPYSKMCELCELCELFVKNPTAFAMGFTYLSAASFRGPQRALLEWGEEE